MRWRLCLRSGTPLWSFEPFPDPLTGVREGTGKEKEGDEGKGRREEGGKEVGKGSRRNLKRMEGERGEGNGMRGRNGKGRDVVTSCSH